MPLGRLAERPTAYLLRTENPVARITQAGQDVAVVIEFAVYCRGKNFYIRVRCVQGVDPLGRGKNA